MSEPVASPSMAAADPQLDRHLLASPAASAPSSSPLSPLKASPPTPSTISSPIHSISVPPAPLPCPQARLLHSWWRWPSYFTLSWLTPLILLGARRTLRHADLPDCFPSEHSDAAYAAFQPHWQAAQARAKATGEPARLLPALRAMVGWQFLLASLLYCWVPTDQLLGPQFLNQLVSYSAQVQAAGDGYGTAPPLWDGYKWAVMMFLSSLATAFSNSLSFHLTQRIFLRVRSVLMQLIYRKTLRLASKHRSDGRVSNLMTSDTQKILELGQNFQGLWTSPIIIAVGIYELYDQVQWSAFLGLAILILFFPVAACLIGAQIKYQALCAAETDKRIVLVNEFVLGIRVLKYLGWERSFLQVMDAQREKEVSYLRTFAYLTSLTFSALLLVPLVMSVVIFASYAGRGEDMTPTVVFTTIALINVIRWPFTMLPMALGALGQALVALGRIEVFLQTPEIDEGERLLLDRVGFEMKDAQFTWPLQKDDTDEEKAGEKGKGTGEGKGAKGKAATEATLELDRVTVGAAASEGLGGGAPGQLPLNSTVGHSSSTTDLRHVEEAKDPPSSTPPSSSDDPPLIPRLTHVTLSLRAGELLMVLGPVGCGKSTLLQGLLGEVDQTAGTTAVGGRVAYVPQTPFIVNATLRDNVTFGCAWDPHRYDAVLTACQLRPDLAILPNGDMTEIGERGINLSGGQKQRVQLARAAYQHSDLVLLDDPLSAVDHHVAEALFSGCINGPLMRDRARVLVTHSLAFVDAADNVALVKPTPIKDCYTVEQGTAAALRASDADFQALLAAYSHGGDGEEGEGERQRAVVKAAAGRGSLVPAALEKAGSRKAVREGQGGGGGKGALMEEEEQETGVVDWQVYRAYIVAGCAWWQYAIIPLAFMGSQAIQTSSDFWLARWSNDYSASVGSNLGVYGALIFATTLVTIVRSFSVSTFGLRASRILHHNLAHSVLRKSLTWYDRTPGGRLTNRFTKDIYAIDYMLPLMGEYALSIGLQVVGTLIVIAIIVPIMLAVFLPLVAIYLVLTRYYRMSNRDLARIESISRSPVAAHFAETLQGSVSIRALKAEPMYIAENQRKTDDNTRALYFSQTVSVWLRVRLDALGSLILGSCAVFAIASVGSTISAGSFGLLISYALGITNGLNYAVLLWSFAEAQMNSVERVVYYSVPRDEEAWDAADPALDLQAQSSHWPQHGAIAFHDVQLRYRPDLPLVLKGITCTFAAGQRVGVCGRTGSGKSSLLVALFRMVEPCGGRVTIDGVDVSRLSLHTLRSQLSIIPQDATLFYGTLRYNVDPFSQYPDDDVWAALSYVQLAAVVRRMPSQLLTPVAEAGANLSAGQRQLLCLARALLRRSRIVCLDEATANVDVETDGLIQRVVREQFGHATIVTIAHRLNTVLDYDRVMVMGEGKVVEWGTPAELRKKEGGLFAAMLQATTREGDKAPAVESS